MLSHNADAFGAPFCTCCDAKVEVCGDCDGDDEDPPTGGIYDFTKDPHTHYGELSFDDLCHRAHVAPWEALGKPEPARWRFVCPCCSSREGVAYRRRSLGACYAAPVLVSRDIR